MAGRTRWRTLAGNLALLLVSTLLILGMLEILARIDYAHRHGKEQRERVQYTESDPLLGWGMQPGAHVQYHRTEYSIRVDINSLGLRDKERSPEPPAGTLRLLTLGDSFVEGHTVEFPETVSQVIERALDAPACPVEVVNAGVGGYSTDQEYLYYRERGKKLGPRILLLFFYYNDVLFNARSNYASFPKPRLVETPNGLAVANLPLKRVALRPARESSPPAPTGGSAAWAWLKERLLRGAPRTYQALARLGLWSPIVGEDRVSIEMKVFRKRPPPVIEDAWHMTDVILGALARETEANGARLLVVYVPSRMEVHDADWELTQMRFHMAGPRWDRQNVLHRLLQASQERRFPVLDLTPGLRRAGGPLGRRTYFRYDGHWNALGHRVAGEEVAAYLRREGWLPACAGRQP